MDMLKDPVRLIALGRLGFGAACVAAPRVAARSIVENPDEMTGAATAFAALTGTRASFLGVIGLSTPGMSPEQRRKVLLLLATVDTIDSVGGLRRSLKTGRTGHIVGAVLPGFLIAALQANAAR